MVESLDNKINIEILKVNGNEKATNINELSFGNLTDK